MSATFDTAVERLLEVCSSHPEWPEVVRAVVVRDLRGRLRLVLQPGPGGIPDQLGVDLGRRLAPWFLGPVLSDTSTRDDERRVAREILGRATTWPAEWPQGWTDGLGQAHPIDQRWTGLQRLLSKQSWFGPPQAPHRWPLEPGAPGVAAFYSFKGGVGRTTALAMVAVALAQRGKRVVCLDLDLEAPGLGDFLGAAPQPSLLDALLTHAATGQLPAEDPVQTVSAHGVELGLVVAGALTPSYLEKLARLDYLGTASDGDSPVALALHKILERIKSQHQPDVILLDCRAGLHDLGGLSLTDLAHVDVLVGRDTPQNHAGIRLTLDVLRRRRPPAERRLLVLQSFVPFPLQGEGAARTLARMRRKLWEACGETVYTELDDTPGEEDDQAPHFALPIPERNDVAAAQGIADVDPATIAAADVVEIVSRLELLLTPEVP